MAGSEKPQSNCSIISPSHFGFPVIFLYFVCSLLSKQTYYCVQVVFFTSLFSNGALCINRTTLHLFPGSMPENNGFHENPCCAFCAELSLCWNSQYNTRSYLYAGKSCSRAFWKKVTGRSTYAPDSGNDIIAISKYC